MLVIGKHNLITGRLYSERFNGREKKLVTKNQKPETRIQKPETRIQNPESRIQQLFKINFDGLIGKLALP